MKLILMLPLLLVACSPGPNSISQDGEYSLIRYYDKENNVICYRVSNNSGIHCFKEGVK